MAFDATLIMFAKYPAPGKVKTRLIPVVGAEAAARLAEAFLLDLVERIVRTLDEKIDCVLCFDPPDAEAAFRTLLASIPKVLDRFQLVPQRGEDLGKRLANGLTDVRSAHIGPYVFIGTDAPDLPFSMIQGPSLGFPKRGTAYCTEASDGGYASLSLPSNAPCEVFENIRWSSRDTAMDQAQQLRNCGIECHRDYSWPDVDESGDVAKLFDRLKRDPSVAPRTFLAIKYECNACISI